MVQGRRVRLEAFPRSYAQAFPIPTRTALNLIANTERTKIVQEGGHTYLQVGLQAMKGEAPRRPVAPVHRQRGLPDPGHAADHGDRQGPVVALGEVAEQVQFTGAAGEFRGVGR